MATKIRLIISIGLLVATMLSVLNCPEKAVAREPMKSCPKFEKVFADYGLLPVEVFSYIAWRESRCNPSAINARWDKNGNLVWTLNKNKTWDSGLLQINSGHRERVRKICGGDLDRLMVLDCNLKVAKFLLDNGGLAHWRATAP